VGIWLLAEPATIYTLVGASLVFAGLVITTTNRGSD